MANGGLAAVVANRRISTKILLIVAVLTIVAVAVGLMGLIRMAEINSNASDIYTKGLRPVQLVEQLMIDMSDARSTMLNHVISNSEANLDKFEAQMKTDDATFATDLAAYTTARPDRQDQATALRQAWAAWQNARDAQMVPVSRRNDNTAAETVRDTVTAPLFNAAKADATQLIQLEQTGAGALLKKSTSTYDSARAWELGLLVVGVVVGVVLALWISALIVRSVRRVSHVVDGLAEGDLTRTAGVQAHDEIGAMATALDTAMARFRTSITGVETNSTALAAAAAELTQVSGQIAGSARDSSEQTETAASAAEEVSRNVQTVAAGSEEMGVSISEIARSATDAARVAGAAVITAESANSIVAKLGQSSTEIGNVVKVITTIAEQTNLLALNATIEAARAGDAGKGFAVVAGEVKDLAQETAKATEEISSRIDAIQTDTTAAVEAIAQIATIIDEVNGYSTTIASAVEQQSATTNEISRNVSEAATGANEIARAITAIVGSAHTTTSGVTESQAAAERLAHMSGELRTLVGQFKTV